MKKILELTLLLVFGCSIASAQDVKIQQSPASPTDLNVIKLAPETAKNLPMLFSAATRTLLFLNIADEISLTTEQKAKLTQLHKNLQAHIKEIKLDYDKENEKLQTILSADDVELDNMHESLQTSEKLKAEMQYYLFESLLKAANILTPKQQQKVVESMRTGDSN